MKPARISVALLVVQLAIVSTVAVQYLHQRWKSPRVWARAVEVDPPSPVHGRYVRLQLIVDGCQSTLPSANAAEFPRDINGAAVQGHFGMRAGALFRANLEIQNDRLVAINTALDETGREGQQVIAVPGTACNQMILYQPVPFYVAQGAIEPSYLKAGQELWMEVTVPPAGPPRPLQLAMKDNGAWKPLASQ